MVEAEQEHDRLVKEEEEEERAAAAKAQKEAEDRAIEEARKTP